MNKKKQEIKEGKLFAKLKKNALEEIPSLISVITITIFPLIFSDTCVIIFP